VEEVVVLGHGFCGGCAAALTRQFEGAPSGEGRFIANWVNMLAPGRAKVCAEHEVLDRDAYLAMELEGIRISLANLRTFPFVAEREEAGTLSLHGCHFSIAEGRLNILDEAEDVFRPV